MINISVRYSSGDLSVDVDHLHVKRIDLVRYPYISI
jgi:hypothetical protein